MLQSMKFHSIRYAGIAAIAAGLLVSFALAQSEDNSRAVRIIEGATPPTEILPASPLPSAPSSSQRLPQLEPPPPVQPNSPSVPAARLPPLGEPVSPAPTATAPDPADPIHNAMSLPPIAPDLGSAPKQIDIGALNKIRVANSAELSVEILPGQDIAVGSRVSFRVTTKKPGYLILIDVDPAGKLTQIYPNPMSLRAAGGNRQNANYVRPGKSVQIPNPSDPYAGFEFVASLPHGTALVVAFLSDRPVQMVDLPDIPPTMVGQATALAYVTKVARELRIPQGEGAGWLQETRWSFDAKFYSIR